jgi:DeoR/GlpR family transcriptional regulator of sugar metabolism
MLTSGRRRARLADVLAQQRQARILDVVRRQGGVRVSDLVVEFGVSDMTIRRDLDALAERNLVAKVHGGAIEAGRLAAHEPGYAVKVTQQETEKLAIAERAAALVEPGSAVGLSAGTTVAALAHRLVAVEGLTVLTNSVPVADVFYRGGRPDQTVILTGGLRTPSDALVGSLAVDAVASHNLDVVFLGVHGMSAGAGFTTPNLMEAEVDRALVRAGRRLVVLADHTKWDTVGLCTIAPLAQADVVITDGLLPAEAEAVLRASVGEVVTVEVPVEAAS